jgi:hypothetical protein
MLKEYTTRASKLWNALCDSQLLPGTTIKNSDGTYSLVERIGIGAYNMTVHFALHDPGDGRWLSGWSVVVGETECE